MQPEAHDVSLRFGGSPFGHLARQLSADMIEQSDLVLALAQDHRGEIVRTLPRASRYTFTLREFVRLLEDLTTVSADLDLSVNDVAGRLHRLVPAIASRRGYSPPFDPRSNDVDDPYGGSLADYALVGEQINDSLKRVVKAQAMLK